MNRFSVLVWEWSMTCQLTLNLGIFSDLELKNK